MRVRRWAAPAAMAAVLPLALVLLALLASPAASQGSGPAIESFRASIEVLPDGSLRVVETIAVDFGAEEHHGIFRTITVRQPVAEGDPHVVLPEGRSVDDVRRVLRVSDVAVRSTAPDQLDVSEEGDALLLRIGDPDVTVAGRQEYELRYTVEGALNAFDDRAELAWDVTGDAWEWPIREVTAEVVAPAILEVDCASGPAGSARACARADVGDGRATFGAGPLAAGEGLTLAVGMARDAVAVPPPLLEERWRLGRALTGGELAVPLTALTAVLGLGGVLLASRGAHRVDDRGAAASPFRVDPPEGLRPAQLRMLVDARADDVAVSATLFDLAARGYLRLEHLDDGEGAHRLERTDRDDGGLLDWERSLRDGMFGSAAAVTSDDFGGDFAEAVSRFRDALEADAVTRGWFPAAPSSLRVARGATAAGIVLAALVLQAAALALTEVALAAVPVVVTAGAVVVLRLRRPLRTEEGRRLQEEGRAFQAFLESTADPRADLGDEPGPLFGSYLPYAIALDAAPQWVARFRDLPLAPERWAPVYYAFPLALLHRDPDRFTASLGGLTTQVTSTTAPTTSTSGGGVRSGGGFGGGGGGGW